MYLFKFDLLATYTNPSASDSNPGTIYLTKEINSDVYSYVDTNNHTLVPVRSIAEALGEDVVLK